jgi:hypothetical protein
LFVLGNFHHLRDSFPGLFWMSMTTFRRFQKSRRVPQALVSSHHKSDSLPEFVTMLLCVRPWLIFGQQYARLVVCEVVVTNRFPNQIHLVPLDNSQDEKWYSAGVLVSCFDSEDTSFLLVSEKLTQSRILCASAQIE